MLTLDIKKPAYNGLAELQTTRFRQVMAALLSLKQDPYPKDARKLVEYPYWRLDIKDCRIIYNVENGETLRVFLIRKRDEDQESGLSGTKK
ncbi:MAG: type II toxin-antitoxin system RelE/ParE family toxin [Synergistaceae bacterium]|jgi:mRNA-degrading endonuclease RelE of RelBE toxin-antitoxin system|nr:type II toxin-antitoxin system RelE/ParE family toxin [Synergistaceae bacterium]